MPDSLLARVVGLGAATNVAAPWEHPLCADFLPTHQEQLSHGKAFSLSIWGAVILYNLMLAEQKARLKHGSEAQPEPACSSSAIETSLPAGALRWRAANIGLWSYMRPQNRLPD